MSKYLKVMFGNKGVNFEYKIDEVNIADTWNPNTYEPKEMGGFNFSTETPAAPAAEVPHNTLWAALTDTGSPASPCPRSPNGWITARTTMPPYPSTTHRRTGTSCWHG